MNKVRFLFFAFFIVVASNLFSQSVVVSSLNNRNPESDIREALLSINDTIIVDKLGSPWILPPMKFNKLKNKVIVFEEGVEILAKSSVFLKTSDALFSFVDSQNIQIFGNAAKICMNKEEYTTGEWRHVISLRGCVNFKIKDLTLRDSGGDGIYIAGSKSRIFCEDIIIDNIKSLNNKRQGLSIISGKNIQINNSIFSETIGTLPGAGLDIEPNRPEDIIDNIKISNSRFINNYGPGIKLALHKLTAKSEDISIFVDNCVLVNNQSADNPRVPAELVIDANKSSPVKGAVKFKDCMIQNSKWGLLYSRKRADAFSVELVDCTANNMSQNESMPIIYLEVTDYYKNQGPLGGFIFKKLNVSSQNKVPLISVRGSRLGTLTLKDIYADITYKGDLNQLEYIKYDPKINENVILKLNKID
ncbi:right-handed parallel beta-helix repeat-containing protein [Aurantibacter sp.]|uniref:right-handed parallel beta-helix repeat-containing protein n=1 Tax=Aurantibacter sp. TaxID=2807103 RepID=UPI003266A65C